MTDPLFNGSKQLDGIVGGSGSQTAPAVVNGTARRTLWVKVTADGIPDPVLADDLRLLINEFVQSTGERREPGVSHPDTPGDIRIATHGLKLDPARLQELHRLMRERVREHMAHEEAEE
jgi:hypothetical protein